MKGLWLEGGRIRWRDDLAPPEVGPGEVLVRVLRAGICNTDLELLKGYYPFTGVPGHEFVGRVEQGPPDLLGARVVGEINAVCGECAACRAGRRHHCGHRTVLGIVGRHGAFAEWLSLPAENLHPVPAAVSLDAATFVEPLAAALQIQEQVHLGPDDRVLVVGDGKLGQLVARTLVLTGGEVWVVGHHPEKTERLRHLGIRVAGEDDVAAGAFDLAIDCAGSAAGFAVARRAVRPAGTLVLKSTYAGRLELDASSLVVDEVTVVGSRCGPFAPALRLLAQGLVQVEDLISARYPLAEGEAALARAAARGTLKVLLDHGAEEDMAERAPIGEGSSI